MCQPLSFSFRPHLTRAATVRNQLIPVVGVFVVAWCSISLCALARTVSPSRPSLLPFVFVFKTGDLYHTYRGHSTEIVCLSFDPHGTKIATGSMDNTARFVRFRSFFPPLRWKLNVLPACLPACLNQNQQQQCCGAIEYTAPKAAAIAVSQRPACSLSRSATVDLRPVFRRKVRAKIRRYRRDILETINPHPNPPRPRTSSCSANLRIGNRQSAIGNRQSARIKSGFSM